MGSFVKAPSPSNVTYAGVPSVTMGTNVTATGSSSVNYLMYQNNMSGDSTVVMGHDVVGVDIEEFCDSDGEFHERKVRIRCPHCAYPNFPFRRKERPKCLETGEEWVGIEYKQPYAHYSTECGYCHEAYYFRLFAGA